MHYTVTFPLERPHCGVPMANGYLGLLVWGKETLAITVNHNAFWDHRNGEVIEEGTSYAKMVQFAKEHGCTPALNDLFVRRKLSNDAFKPQRVPVGRFELVFAEGVRPEKGDLDYDTGALTIRLNSGAELTLELALKQDVLLIDDPANTVQHIEMKPSWDFHKSREWLSKYAFQPPEMLPDGWTITCPNPEDKPLTVRCIRVNGGYRLFAGKECPPHDADAIRAFNRAFWSKFQAKRAKIHVPDPFWQEFFDFCVYKLAAGTIPFGMAGGLQGPWHEEYQHAQWSGDYHFNVNMQMIYGSLCALGAPEHLLPLFDLLESPSYQETMRHNAKVMFGIDDGLHLLHAVDDRGFQCGGVMAGSALDPACGAWTALLYYDYYRYTGDVQFLRDRAYPFIHGVMRVYEAMLDDGFNIPVAISAEYATSNLDMGYVAGRNPSYQLAAVRKLAKILIECSAVLKREPEPKWYAILEKVPEFTTVPGYDSYTGKMEPRIAIWEGQDLATCHRHHSHLGCIWPFDSLPEHPSPEIQRIVDNSIDHWISMGIGKWSEWCIPWAAIIYSRVGLNEAPMQLFTLWKEIFLNEGLATVYLPRCRSLIAHRRHDIDKPKDENEVMQMDGTGGFISAFLEMCADTRYEAIRYFPGMPAKWHDVSFENIALPGGKRISATRG